MLLGIIGKVTNCRRLFTFFTKTVDIDVIVKLVDDLGTHITTLGDIVQHRSIFKLVCDVESQL